jgi:hypothetical protein
MLLYLTQFLLELEKFQVVEKIKTHILRFKFFLENRAVYEITCKNTVQSGRPQMTMWPMCIACFIHKATNTYTEYVILNAFPLHNGRTKALRCTHIACLVSLRKKRTKYFPHRQTERCCFAGHHANSVRMLTVTQIKNLNWRLKL